MFTTPQSNPKPARRTRHMLHHVSIGALALACLLAPATAKAQEGQVFGTMVGLQAGRTMDASGRVSVWQGASAPVIGKDADGRPLMVIDQHKQKALLDWEDFRLKTNEILEFRQQAADWIAVNRVHGAHAAEVNGEIRAKGSVYILNDNGVMIGKDAKINVRQLVTGAGVADVDSANGVTTITQATEKAKLDWHGFQQQTGELLRIQQEKSDWIMLNRFHNQGVTKFDGDIKADGHIYLVAPQGLAVNGKVDAQQVIFSSLYMRDDQFDEGILSYARDYNGRLEPVFSNSWTYALGPNQSGGMMTLLGINNPVPVTDDPNDPLRFKVTLGRDSVVTTGKLGKAMLFGPTVTNNGKINVSDEGQVILAAGDNIYLRKGAINGRLVATVGAYNPIGFSKASMSYNRPPQTVSDERWQAFYAKILGQTYEIGETVPYDLYSGIGAKVVQYIHEMQAERAKHFNAVNNGIINAKRGGSVDFVGWNMIQNGAVDMTSTASFRASIRFAGTVQDTLENFNNEYDGELVPGNGTVIFGKKSLTQITPDLESTDTIPLTEGKQRVGSLKINAGKVHLQEDAVIYMPSGTMQVLLDAGIHVWNNRGAGMNADNEDGTRFLMDKGSLIDLSGWKSTVLPMGYHQVTGKFFAAQFADSPVQRDGPLARKEINIDRRYGTDIANWEGLDNLRQGTLAQFLTEGGTLNMDIGDDFIMAPGSVINVSGGMTTYEAGYVYSTLLRRLDGTVIDIREADPDELYMGLANEWTRYDSKWGKQQSYYIPLFSSSVGRYETGYVEGGKAGEINILAPDTLLQGTLRGETVAGRYQRNKIPAGGIFRLNQAGESETEYVSNKVLISAIEMTLPTNFTLDTNLSGVFGDKFGEEYEPGDAQAKTSDNMTLASDDFFNRSTMGSYALRSSGVYKPDGSLDPEDGTTFTLEKGADLDLKNGASLDFAADHRMKILGNIRTEGGNVALGGMALELGEGTSIDTHAKWYSDYEIDEPVALDTLPRIHGGSITLGSGGSTETYETNLILPDSVRLDTSGGAWLDRDGKLNLGKGGDLSIFANVGQKDILDLGALPHARAFGMGGNGKFSLSISDAVFIGNALPPIDSGANDGDPAALPRQFLITPDFFEKSGFSSISLIAPTVTLMEGTKVHATSAVMKLRDGSINASAIPSILAPSGTDIYAITDIVSMAPEDRPAALRNGMTLSFASTTALVNGGAANPGIFTGKDSLLSTEIGGSISFVGNSRVAGSLVAPAGSILLGAGDVKDSVVELLDTARLSVAGATLITSRQSASNGQDLVDGEVRNGGRIAIDAFDITLAKGSVIDVSGTSSLLDLPTIGEDGNIYRTPTRIDSDGGTVQITGSALDINDATYIGAAGGAKARGGLFDISWKGIYGTGGAAGATPLSVAEQLEMYANWGSFYDLDGNMVASPYGVDFSKINWASALGQNFEFPAGFIVNNRDELIKGFNDYTAAAMGVPPLFVIGDVLSVPTGPIELPEIEPGLVRLFGYFGFKLPDAPEGKAQIAQITPSTFTDGGFSRLSLASDSGIIFSGDARIGGAGSKGGKPLDLIRIQAPRIIGRDNANILLEAKQVQLGAMDNDGFKWTEYYGAVADYGIRPVGVNSKLHVKADFVEIISARLDGFTDTLLQSSGDLRFRGVDPVGYSEQRPGGKLYASGLLRFQADQIYAATGRDFNVISDTAIINLGQVAGDRINGSPYEAAAALTLRAPVIENHGTIRSPLGTITLTALTTDAEGSGRLVLGAGSLTSVSAEGNIIPYGYLRNGDSWIDPFTLKELVSLSPKTVNLSGDHVDVAANSVIDLAGGGDLFAREFSPGIGGTKDWLTGYRDANLEWVDAPKEIFAVLPGYDNDTAPVGFGASAVGVGDKVYLAGGSGLPAGYYTLLPAEYALLPGAFRVTANHRVAGTETMIPGAVQDLTDGSSIQSGYKIDGLSGAAEQRSHGFHVMPGDTLRMRSKYNQAFANSFFTSPDYLKKRVRVNLPVGEVPRIPMDDGSLKLDVRKSLTLKGKLETGKEEKGRGAFVDISSSKLVVTGTNTDRSKYDGYLLVDSQQLNDFGAESLLLGGLRDTSGTDIVMNVAGVDVVVDNAGSELVAPELLLASKGDIRVTTGSKMATRGKLSGEPSNYVVAAAYQEVIDTKGTPWTSDDVLINPALDQGGVVRLSDGGLIALKRDAAALDRMKELLSDPDKLAAINALRATKGLEAIQPGGNIYIDSGATLESSNSVNLDATDQMLLNPDATLLTRSLGAAAGKISFGAVPDSVDGLVFSNNSLGALTNAAELRLKSYSSIDFYGPVTLASDRTITLDSRALRLMDGSDAKVDIRAQNLTLANSIGAGGAATEGAGSLYLSADNIYLEGADKALTGFGSTTITATQRIIGRGIGTFYAAGALTLNAPQITAESGAQLYFDTTGALIANGGADAGLQPFSSSGATVGLTGASVDFVGNTKLTGGTFNLHARQGDVRIGDGARIDVTGGEVTLFDKKVGIDAGAVNLTADQGDLVLAKNALVNVSGSEAGSHAGALNISVGQGEALLHGTIKGDASGGFNSGSFRLLTNRMADFAAFNATLDQAGFRQLRSFEIANGDVALTGTVKARNLEIIANNGALNIAGTLDATGTDGGNIHLAAAGGLTLVNGSKLLAHALDAKGAGGTVLIETLGQNGAGIAMQQGALINVSGTGEGGRTVRFRAPQIGADMAIDRIDGTITGAASVYAEAYRVYENVEKIDQAGIDRYTSDAIRFMDNAGAVQARLGSGVSLVAGIELRSGKDMELAEDWDLSGLRFNGAPGVLTLRSVGDLLINANLSDGIVDGKLMKGDSWSFNLTAGANLDSPSSAAVLAGSRLAAGKGSVIVGGTPDTIEYFYDPAYGNEHRLYMVAPDGKFVRREDEGNYHIGWVELQRNADGKYIDPRTGAVIEKDPATGDYADTQYYARRPLAWILFATGGGYSQEAADGTVGYVSGPFDYRNYIQWNNATGYHVRTGTGAIEVVAGRDLVLAERPSVIYTMGRQSADIAGFDKPEMAQYGERGGDISIKTAGSIRASYDVPQLPNGYMGRSGATNEATGLFFRQKDGKYNQTSWWVNHAAFEGGVGALGGGNIRMDVTGDVHNLSVSIPDSVRVTGGTDDDVVRVAHYSGGGDLSMRVGGNVYGGVYLVGNGVADMNIGGAMLPGGTISRFNYDCSYLTCYLHTDGRIASIPFRLNPMMLTSTGSFKIRTGGDLYIDSIMDPVLINPVMYRQEEWEDYRAHAIISYGDNASADLFSAGGNIIMSNSGHNTEMVRYSSVPGPRFFHGTDERPGDFAQGTLYRLRPPTFSAVAATGDVRILGGMIISSAPKGNLDILAGRNVQIGYTTDASDLRESGRIYLNPEYRGESEGIYMSQALPELLNTVTNYRNASAYWNIAALATAGIGTFYPGTQPFNETFRAELHKGDLVPARIYAGSGDIVSSFAAGIYLPKQTWFQAGGNIYFPSFETQHNNPNDVTLVRAHKGIYFDQSHYGLPTVSVDNGGTVRYGYLQVKGPGRLELEAGTDIYLPDNSVGIVTERTPFGVEGGADIAVSAGFNQLPSYEAFEKAYIDPHGTLADYLKGEDGLSIYLFDRDYPRAAGATGEFAKPEPREGLVNYVRRLQGLAPFETLAEQKAYLDTAWAYWNGLSTDYKTPFYRSVLFLELRTTGRETNDPKSDRYNSTKRGYDVIATLFPGAEKEKSENWAGDYETFASRIISNAGGKVELVIPGGQVELVNVVASAAQTGQPAAEGDRGDALRSGIVTTNGGEINILTHDAVTLNESRILTTKGGNVMIWSSYGDIAAGKGAKTSISPPFFDYLFDNYARIVREPAGLPTGAGIGTLATVDGTPPADVDLIAPNGIIDAGDAGIRVSGNFNAVAVEILGADNIEVAGVVTGLPEKPAAPPTSLDTGDLAARGSGLEKELANATKQVREGAAVTTPSLIEVLVTGFGKGCPDGETYRDGRCVPAAARPRPQTRSMQDATPVASRPAAQRPDAPAPAPKLVRFNVPAQPTDDAIRAVGKLAKINILFDAKQVGNRIAPAVWGTMAPERALQMLIEQNDLQVVQVTPNSYTIRPRA